MYSLNYLILALLLLFPSDGLDDFTDTNVIGPDQPEERTVEVIGIDKMKFVVSQNRPGVVVGDTITTADGEQYLELEGIKAAPGIQLKVELTSKSTLPRQSMSHNWVLLKPDADRAKFDKEAVLAVEHNYIPPEKEDETIAYTGLAAGGQTVSATFKVPEKQGMYDYLCSFPGHFANGMRGKLIVQEEM